jgi:hypothetical protein
MSSPETADWNNLIQKNVKTKDIGNIIMVDEEFITILEGTQQNISGDASTHVCHPKMVKYLHLLYELHRDTLNA